MKQYITWLWIPVEWGIEHPNTHDQDKKDTWWEIEFTQTPYQFSDGRNLAIITYDDGIVTYEDLVAYWQIKPEFELHIITEEEANTLLSELWDITVSNFEFIDNRPTDLI